MKKMNRKEVAEFCKLKLNEIEFTDPQQMYFLGRNGTFKSKGINIFVGCGEKDQQIFMIRPITSKENIGRCRIEVSKKDVPALINLLQKLLAH